MPKVFSSSLTELIVNKNNFLLLLIYYQQSIGHAQSLIEIYFLCCLCTLWAIMSSWSYQAYALLLSFPSIETISFVHSFVCSCIVQIASSLDLYQFIDISQFCQISSSTSNNKINIWSLSSFRWGSKQSKLTTIDQIESRSDIIILKTILIIISDHHHEK